MICLMHTCEEYSFLWRGFYHYWYKNMPDYPIFQVTNRKGQAWSDGLANALSKLNTQWVFYIQDDMWVHTPVDLNQRLAYLTVVDNVKRMTIAPNSKHYTLDAGGYWEQGSHYLNTHQAGIWDKDLLLWLVDGFKENPWENELQGTERLRKFDVTKKLLLSPTEWYHHVCNKGVLNNKGIELQNDIPRTTTKD